MVMKMGKNVKIILFSAVGLAVLGVTIIALKLINPPEIPDDTAEPPISDAFMLTDKTTADVERIIVKNKDGEYEIVPGADGGYHIADFIARKLNVPLNQAQFETAVNKAASLKTRALVEENANDLVKYGLASPSAEVTVGFKGGESVAFCVGNEAPADSATYVRLKESADVYTVLTSDVTAFLKSKFYYIDNKVTGDYDSVSASVIERVTIDNKGGETIVIEALPVSTGLDELRSFNTHKLTAPDDVKNLEIEPEAGAPLIYGIFGLTAVEAVWAGLDETDYELAGLNEPECTVSVSVGGKEYTLAIGNPAAEGTGFYGTCGEVPDVLYIFSASSLPWLGVKADSLIAKMFLMPYIHSLSGLIVETADTRLDFTLTGNADEFGFYLDGQEVDPDRFKSFYQYLIGVKTESFYDEAFDPALPFIARITYRYNYDGRSDDVLEFYDLGNRMNIIRVNGGAMFVCRSMYTVRLLENIAAYVNGGEIILSW